MTLTCVGRSPTHYQQLLLTLYSQRSSAKLEFCDVVVCVGDSAFPLHRCILAAASPKLRAALLSLQPGETILHLTDVSLIGFKKVVKYIYTGCVKMSMEYAHHVLLAARQLHIIKLETICLRYFRKVLNIDPDLQVAVPKLPDNRWSMRSLLRRNHLKPLNSKYVNSESSDVDMDTSDESLPDTPDLSYTEEISSSEDAPSDDTQHPVSKVYSADHKTESSKVETSAVACVKSGEMIVEIETKATIVPSQLSLHKSKESTLDRQLCLNSSMQSFCVNTCTEERLADTVEDSCADDTCQSVANGTCQRVADGTCQSVADGTCQSVADGTYQSVADDTSQNTTDGTCKGSPNPLRWHTEDETKVKKKDFSMYTFTSDDLPLLSKIDDTRRRCSSAADTESTIIMDTIT